MLHLSNHSEEPPTPHLHPIMTHAVHKKIQNIQFVMLHSICLQFS